MTDSAAHSDGLATQKTRSASAVRKSIRPPGGTEPICQNAGIPSQKPNLRGRMGRLMGVRVAASGSYVPDNVVTNAALAKLGCDSDWIMRRTGILERRNASPDQATSDLAYIAASRCLQQAGVSSDQIDLILVATITPDHPTPSTACQLQARLGATAPAMDVGAACAGFMYAAVTASQYISTGNAQCALVVGADIMSRTVDPADKKTYPLFGDAAGAALLVRDTTADPSRAAGLLSYTLGSEGCGGELLYVQAGGSRRPLSPENWSQGEQYLRMEGRSVFKWAVRIVQESCLDVLRHAGVSVSDVRLLLLHQANQRIIDSAVADLGIDPKSVFVNLEKYGNTSAASIPLALDEAVRSGRVQTGDYVLMCGFGAGLAWGTALLRW